MTHHPAQKLRIMHCLRAPVGGLFRHVRDLATAQAALGHEVGVIADRLASDRLTEQRLTDLSQHLTLGLARVPMTRDLGWQDVAAFREIRSLMAARKVDVLHGHGAKGGAYARLVGGRMKAAAETIGVFYTPHGGSLHYAPGSPKGVLYLGLERFLARSTDRIIFESAFSSQVFNANVGAGICPGAVIHNGLLPTEFGQHAPAADATDIVFVGELRHLKGVDLLINALASLRDRSQGRPGRKVTATIVGDGPDAAEFKALASSIGLDGQVTFPGAMPARQAFPLGRVLAMPSRAESFPYIVLEAAAAAVPMVTANVGGISEITDGTDTKLIKPDDAAALAAALEHTLADLDGARQRAARLQTVVAQRFTVDRMTQAILDVYQTPAADVAKAA
jgi:glycosyltransferase involved in cell wall biosynthesis